MDLASEEAPALQEAASGACVLHPNARHVAVLRDAARRLAGLFLSRRYREFRDFLDGVPPNLAGSLLHTVNGLKTEGFDVSDLVPVLRRMGSHPSFAKYFDDLPFTYPQALFFANDGDLKTRVSMGFYDHPEVKGLEVDYTWKLYDARGTLIVKGDETILPRQTRAFDIEAILREARSPARYGTFYAYTAYRHLASLRLYAAWYNENGMTTTHEKGALRNCDELTVCPNVLCDDVLETYLVVANISDAPVTVRCSLYDARAAIHPKEISARIAGRGTMMIPASKCFEGCAQFLAGFPGAIYVRPEPAGQAMYYYFIHNRERGTWQIQHT